MSKLAQINHKNNNNISNSNNNNNNCTGIGSVGDI